MQGLITIKGTTIDLQSVREIKFTRNVGRFVMLTLTFASGDIREFEDFDDGKAREVWDAWSNLNSN